jgi:hypothetical protein
MRVAWLEQVSLGQDKRARGLMQRCLQLAPNNACAHRIYGLSVSTASASRPTQSVSVYLSLSQSVSICLRQSLASLVSFMSACLVWAHAIWQCLQCVGRMRGTRQRRSGAC